MSEKLFLDAVIDPLAATVIVEGEGNERTARFDIAGVPRVDKLLVGKRASEVPTIVTRLCGLCPVTHHLAGMRALDQLVGSSDSMSEQAVQLRRLLHAGSVLDTLAPRLLPDHGLEIRKFAKLVLRAAGCPECTHTPMPMRSSAQLKASRRSVVSCLPNRLSLWNSILQSLPTFSRVMPTAQQIH